MMNPAHSPGRGYETVQAVSSKKVWAGVLAAIAGVAFATILAANAPASNSVKKGTTVTTTTTTTPPPDTTTITMEFDGSGPPSFQGPATVERGDQLRILNNSNPMEIGPHIFSLMRKEAIPAGKDDSKACAKLQLKICKSVAKAHQVDPMDFSVGRQLVKERRPGWDKQFSNAEFGDSWYTETLGEDVSQRVSAKSGKTLSYFCVIHPEMKGKIKVVPGTIPTK